MARKTKRRFIPSSVQSRYLGILKKMGGEPLVFQGKAVLARIRARRPAPAEALGGITGDLQQPVPRGPVRPRPSAPGHAGKADAKPCAPCASLAPADVLAKAACCERCKKLNGERNVAECVAGCMGLLALEQKKS